MSSDPIDILESITDAFFTLDDEWRFTFLNSEAERILFRKREDLLGKSVWEEFPESVDLKFYPEYHKAVSERVTVEFEEYYPPLETWFEVRAYPSEDGLLVHLRDINERKRAEKELKESEANYRALLEDLPELICRSLPDLTRTYVNEGYCHYFGKSRRELIGHSFLELLPKEDHEPLKEHLASLSRENPVGTFEHRVWRHDGEVRWQQWTNRAIYDEQGRFVGYHAVGRDFNVRRLAEEALKENEKRFRSLTDATFEGIVISEEETILETNQAFAEMFGYQLSEVRGMSIFEIHAPELRDQVRRRMSSASDESYESVGLKKDGTSFDVEVHERTAPHRDGGVVRVSAIRDITERKQAEKDLRESEERYRALVQYGSDILSILEIDGTLRYQSPAAERVLGYQPEDMVGTNAFDYVHPEDLEKIMNTFLEVAANEEAVATDDFRFRHADGSWRYLEAIGVNLLPDPEVRGILINSRDITERKRAEEALQSSEVRLRSVVESIGEGLLITDSQDVVLYMNSRMTDLTGYTEEDMLGHPAYELLLPPEEWPDMLQRIAKRIKGAAEKYELLLRHKDGERIWTEVNATPYRDASGEIVGTLGALTDITERKQTEEALKESHRRFRQLFEQSVDALFVHDEKGRFVDCNSQACLLLGYSREELLSLSVRGCVRRWVQG